MLRLPYMPTRKNIGGSTSGEGARSKRWAKLLITGLIVFIVPLLIPDFVPDVVRNLLSRDTSQFVGIEASVKALVLIWLISSLGLIVAGIVDGFLNLGRS